MLVSRRPQMRGHGGNRVAGAHLRSLFLERRAPAVPPSARQLQRQTAGVVLRRLPWRGRRAEASAVSPPPVGLEVEWFAWFVRMANTGG